MEDVVVVGAGWAGLAAASELRSHGIQPLTFEASKEVGGAAATFRDGPWSLEAGPHAFVPQDPALARFLQQNPHAGRDLVPASPAARDRYVLQHGTRQALPRSPPAFLTTQVLTTRAKMRLVVEPFVRTPARGEESVADFARRRFGHGVSHLVDAMVTGVFAGDPERLSARLSFPRLVAAEEAHGSVWKGVRRGGSSTRGVLSAPRDGMGPWLERVAGPFAVIRGERVLSVQGAGPYRVQTSARVVSAKRVVLAVPPETAAALVGVDLPVLPKAPVVVVGLGWTDGSAVRDHVSGYGVLHPEREGRFTLGVLYESSLFPDRTPPGGALVRVLVGGRRHPERVEQEDRALMARAIGEVLETHGIETPPDWAKVLRPPAIPQPESGHAARLRPIHDLLRDRPGVEPAGWGWSGVGIGESVRSGQRAAARLAPSS